MHTSLASVAIGTIALSVIAAIPAAAASPAATSSHLRVEQLGRLPPAGVNLTISPDGRHVAYVVGAGGKYSVTLDGQAGPKFDDILAIADAPADPAEFALPAVSVVAPQDRTKSRTVLISPDSEKLACVARRGSSQFVVLEGREDPAYAAITACGFSPGGSRLAYVAQTRDGQTHVVVDGAAGPPLESVESFVFSATGGHFAYAGTRRNARSESESVLIVDGREIPGVAAAGLAALTFSPNGRRFACVVNEGRGRASVLADGRKGTRYFQIDDVRFSDDGQHLVVTARKNFSQRCVVVDGVEQPWNPVDGEHGRPRLFVSADAARIAFVKASGRQVRMVIDGREGADCDAITAAMFSSDGRRFVHVEQRDAFLHVIDGDRESPGYDAVESLQFSADGSTLAYLANEGDRWSAVVDATAGRSYGAIPPESLQLSADGRHAAYFATRYSRSNRKDVVFVFDGTEFNLTTKSSTVAPGVPGPVFSPDGEHVIYAESRRGANGAAEEQLVLDGLPGPVHAQITPRSIRLSADSGHLAYVAETPARKFELVLNGTSVDTFDRLFLERPATMQFTAAGEVVVLAVQGNAIVRATCRPGAGSTLAQMTSRTDPGVTLGSQPPPSPDAPAAPAAPEPIAEVERTVDEVGQAIDAISTLFGGKPKDKKPKPE